MAFPNIQVYSMTNYDQFMAMGDRSRGCKPSGGTGGTTGCHEGCCGCCGTCCCPNDPTYCPSFWGGCGGAPA